MSASTVVVESVTVGQVEKVAAEIVEADPFHQDPRTPTEIRPRYWADDKPNCLVGNILMGLGFESVVLKQLDAEFPLGELLSSGIRISESRNPALLGFDNKTMDLLSFLQDGQDQGYTWSQCHEGAFAAKSWYVPEALDRKQRPWLY